MLLHVTCVIYLLDSCAINVKSHFEGVDQLMAKFKSATVKNKTRHTKLAAIGGLPQSVLIQ